MNRWASMLLWQGDGPMPERIVRTGAGEEVTIVFVPDIGAAAGIAAELAADGVDLIELCGGFGMAGAARVTKAVGDRAAIGAVTFGIESLTEAAAYKARAEGG